MGKGVRVHHSSESEQEREKREQHQYITAWSIYSDAKYLLISQELRPTLCASKRCAWTTEGKKNSWQTPTPGTCGRSAWVHDDFIHTPSLGITVPAFLIHLRLYYLKPHTRQELSNHINPDRSRKRTERCLSTDPFQCNPTGSPIIKEIKTQKEKCRHVDGNRNYIAVV